MAAQHPLHDIGPVHRNEDPWGIGDDLDEAAERDQGVTVGAAPDHFQPPAVHDPRSLEPQAARKGELDIAVEYGRSGAPAIGPGVADLGQAQRRLQAGGLNLVQHAAQPTPTVRRAYAAI